MIPVTTKALLTEAKYTKLFKDVPDNSTVLTYIVSNMTIDNIDFGQELINDIKAKFRYYEICDEDTDVFWQCYIDTFDEHYHYYKNYLEVYIKDKNIDELFAKVHTRKDSTERWGSESGSTEVSDTGSASLTGSSSLEKSGDRTSSHEKDVNTTTGREHREYDLPHNLVPQTSETAYLSNKETDQDNTTSKEEISESSNTLDSEVGNVSNTSSSSSSGTANTSGETSGGSEYEMESSTIDPKDYYKVKKEILDLVRNVIHEFADKFEDCFLHIF